MGKERPRLRVVAGKGPVSDHTATIWHPILLSSSPMTAGAARSLDEPDYDEAGFFRIEEAARLYGVSVTEMRRRAGSKEVVSKNAETGHRPLLVWVPPDRRTPNVPAGAFHPANSPVWLFTAIDDEIRKQAVMKAQAAVIEYLEGGKKGWRGIAERYGLNATG